MRGEQVAKFLGKFIEINFSKLINNDQTIEFVIKLLELRKEKVFEIQSLDLQAKHEFSTSSFAEAVYLVELTTKDNKTVTKKVLVSQFKN